MKQAIWKKLVTAANAPTAISNVRSTDKTVVVDGQVTETEFKAIVDAIKALSSSYKVILDLSHITGLNSIPKYDSSNGPFQGCTQLEGIILPAGVSVEGGAFMDCTNLKYIKGGLSPHSGASGTASGIIWGCSSLEYIVFPVEFSVFKTNFFHGCTKLSKIYYMGTEAQWAEQWTNKGYSFSDMGFTGSSEPEVIFESKGP